MPKDKDLKRLVRARVAETGERYTTARAALVTRDPSAVDDRKWHLVEGLGDPTTLHRSYEELKALPPDVLRPLTIAGTGHSNWRVRRGCCRLLDDLDFSSESYAALARCLDDPEPRVRRAAVHSLSCEHCKPDGCEVDPRPALERGARDPNRRVREMAVGPLTWGPRGREPWALRLLERVAADDPSPKLRQLARDALNRAELMARTDRERQELNSVLVKKTQRHTGKWVAIHDGRIVDAGRSSHAIRRAMNRRGYEDARIYWVAEQSE